MTWIILALIIAIIIWSLNKGQRKLENARAKRQILLHGDKITYTKLASRRHNIRTAHNMIKLDLVWAQSPDDEKISYLYAGGNPNTNQRTRLLAHRFGLNPDAPNYVGD